MRLTEMGPALGFTFAYADDMRMWNTFRALQVIDRADGLGRGHDLKQALFAAYFTHRRNVSDNEMLVDVAAELGLDRAEATRVLDSGERADTVREKELFWTSRGIHGVPATIFKGQHLLSGAEGTENYAAAPGQLTAAGTA